MDNVISGDSSVVAVSAPDAVWKLGVSHQEAGDVAGVQLTQQLVNARVHYRLPDQRQRAMLHVDTQCSLFFSWRLILSAIP